MFKYRKKDKNNLNSRSQLESDCNELINVIDDKFELFKKQKDNDDPNMFKTITEIDQLLEKAENIGCTEDINFENESTEKIDGYNDDDLNYMDDDLDV